MDSLHLVNYNKECQIGDNLAWALYTFLYVFLLVLFSLYFFIEGIKKAGREIRAKCVLLFTAHPDDEVMFFGPTIIQMLKNGVNFYLICLSDGNYEGDGTKRVEELFSCTKELGISNEKVLIIRDDRLKDGPKESWPIDHLSNFILKYIDMYEPEAVLTFDSSGVSSHPNHIALYKSLKFLINSHSIPPDTSIYTLSTVNLFRKYLSFFDMSLSVLSPGSIYTVSPSEYIILIKAMSKHDSQFIWFRKLYVLFSRYMFINNYKKLA